MHFKSKSGITSKHTKSQGESSLRQDAKKSEEPKIQLSEENSIFLKGIASKTNTPEKLLLGFAQNLKLDLDELKKNLTELLKPECKDHRLGILDSTHRVLFEFRKYDDKILQSYINLELEDIKISNIIQREEPESYIERGRIEGEIKEFLENVELKRMLNIPSTLQKLLMPNGFEYIRIGRTLYPKENIMAVFQAIENYSASIEDWTFNNIKVKFREDFPCEVHLINSKENEYVFYIAPYISENPEEEMTEGKYIDLTDLIIMGHPSGVNLVKSRKLRELIKKQFQDQWWEINKKREEYEKFWDFAEYTKEIQEQTLVLIKELYAIISPKVKKDLEEAEKLRRSKGEFFSLERMAKVFNDFYWSIKKIKPIDRMIREIVLDIEKQYQQFEHHIENELGLKRNELNMKMARHLQEFFTDLKELDMIKNMDDFNQFHTKVKEKMDIINAFAKDIGW